MFVMAHDLLLAKVKRPFTFLHWWYKVDEAILVTFLDWILVFGS